MVRFRKCVLHEITVFGSLLNRIALFGLVYVFMARFPQHVYYMKLHFFYCCVCL